MQRLRFPTSVEDSFPSCSSNPETNKKFYEKLLEKFYKNGIAPQHNSFIESKMTDEGIINILHQTLDRTDTQHNLKKKCSEMLDYLDKSISELNTQITPNEIAPLSACLKKLREESSQSDDSDSLIAATGLAFTLTIHVRNQLNTNNNTSSAEDTLTNMEKAIFIKEISD